MKRMALLGLVSTVWLAQSAFAQSAATPPPAPPKAAPSATPDTTGAPKTKQAKPQEKQKAYTGNTGKKNDPGTACSSSRPTSDGSIDCGTSGNAATPGKAPK